MVSVFEVGYSCLKIVPPKFYELTVERNDYFLIKMKRSFGFFLVALFGVLLAVVIVQETIAIFEESKQKSSSITFPEIPNGVYQQSVLLMNAIKLGSDFDYLEFLSSCECRLMSFKNRSDINSCRAFEIQVPVNYTHDNGSFFLSTIPTTLILNPQSYVDRAYLNLTCNLTRGVFFSYAAFPVEWGELIKLTSKIEDALAFYQKHFELRPLDFLTAGHKVVIKYSEKHFVDENGVMGPTGRFIYSDSSSTSAEDPLVTEMIFTYASSKYELVSVLTNKSYFRIVKLFATFLLASERTYSIYKRLAVRKN